MRLTLRTLLAYLDNTLDPNDAELLRAKLEESGFATQLVQRIRNSLTSAELTAPPPDSVHPIGEANVISEFLDSTLTTEQVAEIERACLESEPHLAEAAACHQILTMVLGKPAAVSDQLRQRIYLLPDSKGPPTGSFSSVSIPADGTLGATQDELPIAEDDLHAAGKTVQPVGPADSGVSDAPTRLRESESIDQELPADAPPGIAGSRGREHLEVSDVYGGSIRPSRITPWLVTLALAGVLLFALSQIFAPLLEQRTAQKKQPEQRISLTPDVELAEPAEDVDHTPDSIDETPSSDTSPTDNNEDAPEDGQAEASSSNPDAEAALETPHKTDDDQATASPTEEATTTETPVAPARDEEMPDRVDSVAADAPDKSGDHIPDPLPMEKEDAVPAEEPPASKDLEKPDKPPVEPAPAADVVPVANLTTDKTFLVSRIGDGKWLRVGKETMIGDGVPLINPPGFRSSMSIPDGQFVLTLVDATSASWVKSQDENALPNVNIDFGRALLTAKQADVTTTAILGGSPVTITMNEPETVVGIEVRYFRAPGMDPSVPENHARVARVFSIQGDFQLQTEFGNHTVKTGQQWLLRGAEAAPVGAMTATPAWVDPPNARDASIESEARDGLLQLINNEQELMLDLREAVTFRRSEVGALAAQTLLLMGHGDVYFGGDGVLGNPKQRAYWPEHYRALRTVVDYNPESAEALAKSITEMDAADGKTLYRLLVGFSEKQLVENGDEELVDLLDSSSMAARVLAIENLRAITGTTLYYRAEEDNLTRRAQATKKWRTRQRKGDIRWNVEQ